MSNPVEFLQSLARAVAALNLYQDGHPVRGRAVDSAFDQLQQMLASRAPLRFTFLADEVVCGSEPLKELAAWDWSARLAACGMQRMEFDADVTLDDFEALLDDMAARLTLSGSGTAERRQMVPSRIRIGGIGLTAEPPVAGSDDVAPATLQCYPLHEEADTVRWLHEQVQDAHALHLAEAEAVVRSLALTIQGDDVLLPLLRIRSFDEYTTTHAINVSVLAMALAGYLGLAPRDVRAFGVAGLLHDIGKVGIPREILVKPGRLTDEERAIINSHTVDGARIIMRNHSHLDLAAVVAYEHHIMIDGGGYPDMRFRRACHYASRVVHVCDVYDALRTRRPYRDAWDANRVLDYITQNAGTDFDATIAHAFVGMMRQWERRVGSVTEDGALLGMEFQA
jgi:putative nucleotidyltransferase with HDIG domain